MARTLDRAVSTPFMEAMAAGNIVINGGMEVSQEIGTTQTTLSNGAQKYALDMISCVYNHTAATAVVKFQQLAPANSPSFGLGFPMSLQMIATTAITSPAAGDYAYMQMPIEGYRMAKLGFGSATNPQYVTLGFWVSATITGTMTVALRNSASNRSYPVNVTINAANTWEYKTVTIPVDSSGTWLTTSGVGAYLTFCFGTGASLQGTNAIWNAAAVIGTSSTTNFFASNNNNVNITGVGMWAGTDAPTAARSPFAQRPYTEELQLCKRYFWRSVGPGGGGFPYGLGNASAATQYVSTAITFPVAMRATPAGAIVGSWTVSNCGAPALGTPLSSDGFVVYVQSSAAGSVQFYPTNSSAYVTMDARL